MVVSNINALDIYKHFVCHQNLIQYNKDVEH